MESNYFLRTMTRPRVTMASLLIFFVLAEVSNAQVKFTGFGATGYRVIDRDILRGYNQRAYYEAKVQAEIKVNKKIEAQIDIRGDSEDHSVILREVSAKLEYWDRTRIKVGNLRIPFGLEQMIPREEYVAIERSHLHRQLSGLGYGGRAVSIWIDHRYSKKEEGLPFSIYASLYKNNSLTTGLASRVSYHRQDLTCSVGGLIQHRGGDEQIDAGGVFADLSYNDGRQTASIEIFYVADPVEGIRRRIAGGGASARAAGAKALGSIEFKTGGEVVEKIEPFLLLGSYVPDVDETRAHTLQSNLGVNVYLDKEVRIRLNADLLFTKHEIATGYSTHDSRYTLELQVRY